MKPLLVSGHALRAPDGTLLGFQCPVSYRKFYGPSSNDDQYEHTKMIMEMQGPDMSYAQRRQLYLESQTC